ncbi:zinc finger protein 239-like [Periplaneta americana]|uniref:zinc finger protein 239-like n=1 Tax=Periplaneta americana TaxID=6978 RepID=UPI0037E7FB2A
MDEIKTEPEADPLAVQTGDSTDLEEKKPLSEGGNLLDLNMTRIKQEYVDDDNYDLTAEIKFEEIILPNNFAMVKCEAEEESCDLGLEAEQLNMKAMAEQDEVFCESIADNVISSNRNSDEHEDDVRSESPESCVSSEKPGGEGSVECRYNDKQHPLENNLGKQCRSHTSNSSSSVSSEESETTNKCHVCGKVLSTVWSLKCHLRTHTGEVPYKCDDCGKCFSDSCNLRTHARVHTGEKPFKCHICGKCFLDSSSLTRHVRVHTGEKPFTCNVCGKRFTQSANLKVHARLHTGAKPFKCDICGNGFSQSGNLKMHKRLHTGEKPFKCVTCGKCFSQSATLNRHARQHTA